MCSQSLFKFPISDLNRFNSSKVKTQNEISINSNILSSKGRKEAGKWLRVSIALLSR